MTQSDLPQDVLKRAEQCHLSGLRWAIVILIYCVLAYFLSRTVVLETVPQAILLSIWFGITVVAGLLAFPFLSSFLTTYIFWRTHRSYHPFVDDCGRAATNFQATVSLYGICASLVCGFLIFVTCGPLWSSGAWRGNALQDFVGLAALLFVPLLSFVWCSLQILVAINASNKALEGQIYVYPFSKQFFS